METLKIEVPVSVGDKMYRTNSSCELQTGEVIEIDITHKYYKSGNQLMSKSDVKFIVNYGYYNEITYTPEDLGIKVHFTKESLIKYIVDSI